MGGEGEGGGPLSQTDEKEEFYFTHISYFFHISFFLGKVRNLGKFIEHYFFFSLRFYLYDLFYKYIPSCLYIRVCTCMYNTIHTALTTQRTSTNMTDSWRGEGSI